jgi:alpha-beta hydrolase superfamily lysophospholipase
MSIDADGPVVLALDPDPVLVLLHLPRPARRPEGAILFCPPFGWEEVCSYRALRTWANVLAEAGFVAARLQLPSSGDSGGSPRDPARLEAWTSAVEDAAEWLRTRTGADRVTAIGIGLGGMLACRAIARGAPIEDLVLWSVRSRGAAQLREMRAYSRVIADLFPGDARPDLPASGDLDLAGFLMSGDTARALEAVDIKTLGIPRDETRRVLLIPRDGLPIDRPLREHFERAGAAVTIGSTEDYTPMMLEPQDAVTPRDTIATTLSWLQEGSAASPRGTGGEDRADAPRGPASAERTAMDLVSDGHPVRETWLGLDTAHGEALAVVTEGLDAPPSPVCAVWVGAGALRHIGPSRMWVEIARRWAARGVTTVRVDLAGIGESEDPTGEPLTNANLYSEPRIEQARAVLDQLAARGLPDRFVLCGLCAGAYWTLHVAMADERVIGAMMINLYAFTWSEALAAERDTSAVLRGLRSALWRRVLRGRMDRDLMNRTAQRLRPARIRSGVRRPAERAQAAEARRALVAFGARGTQALFLLSQGEALHGQLSRLGLLTELERWPNVRVEALPTRDHVFRARWLQPRVHESVDRALERTLEAAGVGARGSLVR